MKECWLQDVVWLMKDEAKKQSPGTINWELIACRLHKEGYLNERKERDIRHDKKSSGNDDIIDPRD